MGHPATAVQWEENGQSCRRLGDFHNSDWSLINPGNPAKGLQLEFTGGDICGDRGPRRSTLILRCGGQDNHLKTVQEQPTCHYKYEMLSPHACPVSEERAEALSAKPARSKAFLSTGGKQTYTVPADVNMLAVKLWGDRNRDHDHSNRNHDRRIRVRVR